MLTSRLIPCLLIKNGQLVKTTRFANPVYVGDPLNAIRIFNDKEVDELMVLDIDATASGRGPDYELLEELAGECFMPLAYGGGIQSAAQAQRLFSLGIEKLCIQSALVTHPSLLTELATQFGRQSIVAVVNVKRNWLGKPVPADKRIRCSWEEHIQQVVELGAGEVVLQSIEKDGTLSGLDFTLLETATRLINVPLTIMGGLSSLDDYRRAAQSGASGIAGGAFFVFRGTHRAVLITYPTPEELKPFL